MSLDKQSTIVQRHALTGMLCSSPADCFPQCSDSTQHKVAKVSKLELKLSVSLERKFVQEKLSDSIAAILLCSQRTQRRG